MSLPVLQDQFGLDDLRLIVAVGDAGSLSLAAKRLQLHHASLWKRLGGLEQRLGVRLFDRHRAGYAATAAGEEALDRARRILAEVDGLARRLAGQDIRPNGVVRLTTTETLLDVVAPAVGELRRTSPGILVELSTANAFATLTRREADIALRPAAEAPEGLIARRLGTVATAVYGAVAHGGLSQADLLALDWLAPDDSLSHLASARWVTGHVAAERIVCRAGSLTALAAMARAGVGVAPLPCIMADRDPGLARLTPAIDAMATSLWLLTHPDLRRTVRIRATLDALQDHLSGLRKRLAGVV